MKKATISAQLIPTLNKWVPDITTEIDDEITNIFPPMPDRFDTEQEAINFAKEKYLKLGYQIETR
jgi:hypothetical protein